MSGVPGDPLEGLPFARSRAVERFEELMFGAIRLEELAEQAQLTLDALFTHPNTAPFISKQLIQRLVTSNPSPAYVYRVAQKFVNNGSGTRGDLAAVVRAILTDHEARSPVVAASSSYGKLKEPLLRLTGLLRSFNASSTSGRFLGYQNTVDGVPITSATPRPATAAQINQAPNTFSSTR